MLKSSFLDGVFDHKAYSERALSRMIKAKAKADRHIARQAAANSLTAQVDEPSEGHGSITYQDVQGQQSP